MSWRTVMGCGDIAWWRDPDLKALLERHGAAEHFVIQADFLEQPHRNGRIEFSVPGASKSGSGRTGYADIVSVASSEIWEIKPKHLEDKAVSEAVNYVKRAKAACGPP